MIRLPKKLLATLGAAAVLSIAGTPASAVTYVFGGGPDNQSSLVFVENNRTLTVSSTGGNINQGGNGLGVSGAPEGGRLGFGESLTFDFAPLELLDAAAVVFEAQSQDEDFSVTLNGVTSAVQTIAGAPGTSTTPFDIFSLFDAPVLSTGVTSFTINGLATNGGGNLGIRIASISVTPVPLPATVLLLLAGVGGLAFAARRKA